MTGGQADQKGPFYFFKKLSGPFLFLRVRSREPKCHLETGINLSHLPGVKTANDTNNQRLLDCNNM